MPSAFYGSCPQDRVAGCPAVSYGAIVMAQVLPAQTLAIEMGLLAKCEVYSSGFLQGTDAT